MMNHNFTFKRKKSHKLFFSIIILMVLSAISIIAYTSYAEIGVEYEVASGTSLKMSCEVVYSIPDAELEREFVTKESAPKAFGVVRRCENQEIVCYYVGQANSMFCQFKSLYTSRSKGNLQTR